MPPDMMGDFQDIAQGCFDQYMGDNPDAAPMDAFDAVGAGIDHHMADMPPDMNWQIWRQICLQCQLISVDLWANAPPVVDFRG